jgi:monothiol glutaredoxin
MSNLRQEIETKVKSKPVFVFMKGTPTFPMCGFSARTIEVLKATKAEFDYVNILEAPEMWEELKKFTNWPTSPQVFVKGEFIGGCDITCEMFESGDLQNMLK